MTSQLSPDQLAQLQPVLASLARLVASGIAIDASRIRQLLRAAGMEPEVASIRELEQAVEILQDARENPNEDSRQVAVEGLRLRGWLEAPARAAVTTAVGPQQSSSEFATSAGFQVNPDRLEWTLPAGQSAHAEIMVEGGPGTVTSDSDQVTVSPARFGAGATKIGVTVRPLGSSHLLWANVTLVTQAGTKNVPIVAQWEDVPAAASLVNAQTSQIQGSTPAPAQQQVVPTAVRETPTQSPGQASAISRAPVTSPVLEPTQAAKPPVATQHIPAWVWVAAGAVVMLTMGVLSGPWWPRSAATPTPARVTAAPSAQATPTTRPTLEPAVSGSLATNTPAQPTVAPTAPTARAATPTVAPAAWQPPTSPIAFDWVEIPAGGFTMGSDPNQDSLASDSEQPQHTEDVDTFWMARTEVTVAQFAAFVEATGYQTTVEEAGNEYTWRTPRGSGSNVDDKQDHPATWVTWDDAQAFASWAGVRLPTEAEWEKACRGVEDSRIYPWGDEPPDTGRANYYPNVGDTTAVGSYPAGESPYGLVDMVGNVWEWTQTKWRDNYNTPADDSPEGAVARVVRGGSFLINEGYVRCACAVRANFTPANRGDLSGFRVVVSPNHP